MTRDAVSSPTWAQPVLVRGALSPAGVFNHPDATICQKTGVRMGAHRTIKLVSAPRPSLGVLVDDEGSSWPVDHDMLLGRSPCGHELVEQGCAEPVVLLDDRRTVSRCHVWLRLDGWDLTIVDLGSHNGTSVHRNGTDHQATSHVPMILSDGDTIRVGARSLTWRPCVR